MSPSLVQFIRAAKLATYAAQGDFASVQPLLPGTKQLEYVADDLVYRDIYAGMNRFVGQEIVYQCGQPVWSMSYSGGLASQGSSAAAPAIYAFLRQALRQCPVESPLRGPSEFRFEDLEYTCRVQGTMARFTGQELVKLAGTRVYEFNFGGGVLAV